MGVWNGIHYLNLISYYYSVTEEIYMQVHANIILEAVASQTSRLAHMDVEVEATETVLWCQRKMAGRM